jgi:PAS domain S-box-containing protein
MRQLSDMEASEAALSSAFLRRFCLARLADVTDGAAVVFDHELRVRFAEGTAMAGAGVMVGRLLPDLMPAESWEKLRGPYEAALTGQATTLDFVSDGTVFSIDVSPIELPGEARGALAVSRAVSEERRSETAAAKRTAGVVSDAQLLGSAFDESPNGMSAIAPDGHWLRINAAYCRMLGFEPQELTGRSFQDVTYPDDVPADREFFANALAGGPAISAREKRYVRKDGSIVWANVRAELIRDESGEPLYFVSHLQDITERRAAQESRRESDRTLRAVIDHMPAIICVKGRDHRYKLVNREFEQVFGVTQDWIIGRSDDEILPPSRLDDTHAKDLLVLDGGQTTQEEETLIRDGQERVLLRTRFPLLDEHGETHAVCIAATDITERRLEERSKRERLECSELIYSALAQDRLVLHGQPIIRLVTMQTTSVELLIRMRKVRGGEELVGPGEFLPAAERFDLISVIDDWVIDHAIDLASAGHSVTVNVSAKTISDPQQAERIAQTVLAKPGAARNLVFEITETAVADNVKAAGTFAERLRKLGCAIALDDFGVGHGTFTYLRHLPVDYLKIDIQFVRNLLNDDADHQIVEAIIALAKQFNLETVAEGVEDQATLDELREMGADYAQGYWIGRPSPLPGTERPRNSTAPGQGQRCRFRW